MTLPPPCQTHIQSLFRSPIPIAQFPPSRAGRRPPRRGTAAPARPRTPPPLWKPPARAVSPGRGSPAPPRRLAMAIPVEPGASRETGDVFFGMSLFREAFKNPVNWWLARLEGGARVAEPICPLEELEGHVTKKPLCKHYLRWKN